MATYKGVIFFPIPLEILLLGGKSMGTGRTSNYNCHKRRIKELKSNGICAYCGRVDARKDKIACQECADKTNAKQRKRKPVYKLNKSA